MSALEFPTYSIFFLMAQTGNVDPLKACSFLQGPGLTLMVWWGGAKNPECNFDLHVPTGMVRSDT